MKAPDKIYLATNDEVLNMELDNGFVGIAHEDSTDILEPVEYIRKGALLEWAKEEQELTISLREDAWWDEVINKIKSM